MKITGGCHCGAVRYEVAMDELPLTYACHCLDCQTASSSAFGLHALMPEETLQISGRLTSYRYGNARLASHHRLCAECHTRIYNTTNAAPGMVVLRAGTLDASSMIGPCAHIWVKRKQPWLQLPIDMPQWPESPTPEAFAQALARSPGTGRAARMPCN
ncbi:GFA family protein [Pseudomonas sp. D2-3]